MERRWVPTMRRGSESLAVVSLLRRSRHLVSEEAHLRSMDVHCENDQALATDDVDQGTLQGYPHWDPISG